MIFPGGITRRRAKRAMRRQLAYQQEKAARLKGHELEIMAEMARHSRHVRQKIEDVAPLVPGARVLEVGSGAHGLIFFFGAEEGVGVDPLAEHYASLFGAWQGRVQTMAARGENLPFAAASFDMVLCENVIDHAENPGRILEEISRVLRPGGTLYFQVNIHHAVYDLASRVHGAWQAVGLPFEVGPFADHTVHLTKRRARRLLERLPLQVISVTDNVEARRHEARNAPSRHAGDWLKRVFFKNAQFEVIAIRLPGGA